jgi:hypothetical protein
MPRLIKHIDKIAREKNRTVLFVSFEPEDGSGAMSLMHAPNHSYSDYEDDANRAELIAWLDAKGIGWEICGHIASENEWIAYNGNIYLDVPWNETDSQFVKVQELLETPHGDPRNPKVKLWACDLELAMKNAHHDEPGFWEKWAEDF